MKLFQTKSAKKKGIYHIMQGKKPRRIPYPNDTEMITYLSYCRSGDFYVGTSDAPGVHPELIDFSGQPLCPACVEQAYKDGRIGIVAL